MKITLTQEEREKLLFEAFCGAGHLHYGDMSINVDQDIYDAAKALVKENFLEADVISREDVWIEAVRQGFEVWIIDNEDGEEYLVTADNLSHLDNLPLNIISKVLIDDEGYDAEDLDWVLEYIMFNDKIYG